MLAPEGRVRARIEAEGPLSFAEVMEEALYGEGGYYAGERAPIGPGGDFVTGSSLSGTFAAATGRLVGRLDGPLGGRADYFEAGYGNGEHLAGVAAAVGGAGRRVVGWDRVERPVVGARTVGSLAEVEARSVVGLVFSYELFDALPVRRFVRRANGGIGELRVGLDADGDLEWIEGDTDADDLRAVGLEPSEFEPGQIADMAAGWAPLYEELARRLDRGLMVTCDYGYERRRLLDARVRRHGTLACYSQQTVHRDALRDLGGQDLTAHVDFTALREAGEAAGLETVSLTRQALWLAACGVFEGLASASRRERLEATRLLDPAGMGGDIRVLVQSRGVDAGEVLDNSLLS